MRTCIALFAGLLLLTAPAWGEEKQPGDFGYMHEEFHDAYQVIYKGGKCHCTTGQCRATIYRLDEKSPTGVKVYVNRTWCNVPREGLYRRSDGHTGIPPVLWSAQAHVCAYEKDIDNESLVEPGKCPVMECIIINSGT